MSTITLGQENSAPIELGDEDRDGRRVRSF
jgi:hypothetical protein